jgi:hypothetical protein
LPRVPNSSVEREGAQLSRRVPGFSGNRIPSLWHASPDFALSMTVRATAVSSPSREHRADFRRAVARAGLLPRGIARPAGEEAAAGVAICREV